MKHKTVPAVNKMIVMINIAFSSFKVGLTKGNAIINKIIPPKAINI